jgi:hypothetical protein
MSIDDFLNELNRKVDPQFDQFIEYLMKNGITAKLSYHDIRMIFYFFKDSEYLPAEVKN